jgi:hypothetical protein
MSPSRIVVSLLFCVVVCAGRCRADNVGCWQMVYGAIEHSAGTPHAEFTSYTEHGNIMVDGNVLVRLLMSITYRDDGIALINDSRWDNPIVSNSVEPGPPILGPYGTARSIWLMLDNVDFPHPLIADVHAMPSAPCDIENDQNYDNMESMHVALPAAPTDRPALKELWIDPKTMDILKVIVSGELDFPGGTDSQKHFADFEVELEHVGQFIVVRHVTWKYKLRVYSQYSSLFGEYYFDGYTFSSTSPAAQLGMQ